MLSTTGVAGDNFAVELGYPVSVSSTYNADHTNWRLDHPGKGDGGTICQAWSAGVNDLNQWIQVTSIKPSLWTGVTIQGRGDADQWVTKFMVKYTNDGKKWYFIDNACEFTGNADRNTKVTQQFSTPVTATTIRICPKAWNGHISLRFEAYFKTPSS